MDLRKRPEDTDKKHGGLLDQLVTEYKTNQLCHMNVLRTISHVGITFMCNNYSHALGAVAHTSSFQAALLLTERWWEEIYYRSVGCVQTQRHEIHMCLCEEIPLQFLQKLWFIRNPRPHMAFVFLDI